MLEKLIKRKIYALLLESNKFTYLSIQYAFTLEEAAALAKKEFEKENPQRRSPFDADVVKIGLYTTKNVDELNTTQELKNTNSAMVGTRERSIKAMPDIEDLFDMFEDSDVEVISGPIPKELLRDVPTPLTPEEERNLLIKKIIDNKDLELFELNKDKLSLNEKKYIIKHLK